ncbi:hypothetical protein LEMLEM_LOCUS18906 [Lemmus lemmus]
MDEWSRRCQTTARLQPTALGNDRAWTETRGGRKDRECRALTKISEYPWQDAEGSGGLSERADVWSGGFGGLKEWNQHVGAAAERRDDVRSTGKGPSELGERRC